ncbi:capsid protein [Beak and feather disease virus]|uniref:Capsid protein n=1 Tax=Beak and feather disease virus TaxID=77856 RepID=A0A097HWE4_BFDV|nr:capsid protein [Beak and feather disease virus]AIT52905.1 capsid protein [Beak and feather disease virus]
MNCACAIFQIRRRYARPYYRRRHIRRYRRRRRYFRRRRFTTNRIYTLRLKRQFKFEIRANTTSPGNVIWNSDYITFTLSDFITNTPNPQNLNFEDYRIKLAKMELRPTWGHYSFSSEGFGHTAVIQDSRLTKFKTTADQQQDPVAPFDGARKWYLAKGFKRLLRPKPQITIEDLSTANQSAALWLNSTRTGWIPLQGGPNQAGVNVKHYGLAFSFPQPKLAITYECQLTLYVQFRQFAPNNPNT